jgi:chromate transporter
LLRELCVHRKRWIDGAAFEDAIAACNLLPGPASTQLAMLCAWNVAGAGGVIVGGVAFIMPGLIVILGLAAILLAPSPPTWVLGTGAGASAAVAAVAVHAGVELLPASWARARARGRWIVYALIGGAAAATVGPWLVLVLLGCGAIELSIRQVGDDGRRFGGYVGPLLVGTTAATGGLLALAWVALKVGALSYGGGFVIVPLMQHDAVEQYHWMTNSQFLDAVALGQITPGPVVHTIAVVGFAAGGIAGGLLAAIVAFSPSFVFVLGGARHFDRLRHSVTARAFLDGAGPAAVGAILGVAIPLTLALSAVWQLALLAGAAVLLFVLRRSVVTTMLLAALVGLIVVELGAPLP